jgi:hypothetical protein
MVVGVYRHNSAMPCGSGAAMIDRGVCPRAYTKAFQPYSRKETGCIWAEEYRRYERRQCRTGPRQIGDCELRLHQ